MCVGGALQGHGAGAHEYHIVAAHGRRLFDEQALAHVLHPHEKQAGARRQLEWISAFSRESETLFPPLTYLQPTGRTQVGCRYFTVTYCC